MCIRDSKTVVGMVNGMLEEMNITVPVALHLDHGSYDACYKLSLIHILSFSCSKNTDLRISRKA